MRLEAKEMNETFNERYNMTPQERTLITRVISKDKCSQTQEEVC